VPELRVTFIFNMGQYSWTESWWKNFSSPNFDSARDICIPLAQKRAVMLGENASIVAIRISNAEDVGRQGKTYYVEINGLTAQGCTAPAVALNISVGDQNNENQKLVQFRGFWDSYELGGGLVNRGDADFLGAFNSWKAYLFAQSFGWRGIVSQQQFTITTYTVSSAGKVVLTTGEPMIPGLGAPGVKRKGRISGLNGKSVLNGQQIIRVLDANTAELTKPTAATAFISQGTLTVPAYTLRVATNALIQRVGKRQAGRPLLVSRGRRPARPRT